MKTFYERNGITIYCGDCLEVMAWLQMVFDAIICDLPYGTTACSWDTIIPFEPLWVNYKRLAKGNGAVVLFGSQPFTSKLVMSNLEWFKYEWIWEKNTGTRFLDKDIRPLNFHENILLFYQKQPTYNSQRWKGTPNHQRKPYQYKKSSNIYNEFHSPSSDISGEKYPRTTLKFNTVAPSEILHNNQKPVDLLQYLIRTYTNPGDLILDNTMGSGTTLVAAQNEGRRAVGIELSEEYCKTAVDRLKQPSFFSIPNKLKNDHQKQMRMKL